MVKLIEVHEKSIKEIVIHINENQVFVSAV